MLTAKQHELLQFIHDCLRETGISPSFEEMKRALGLKSKSGVHRLIGALEERGFLRRLPNRARALEVLRLPEDSAPAPASAIVNIATARARRQQEPATLLVPLVGRIAAGLPIEAIEQPETLGIPAMLLGPGEHYALQVVGDSMTGAGIFDGDFALIRRTDSANEGDIIVALVDDSDATLKYFHREKNMVRLDPANPAYPPQSYAPSRVRIQGRLAGLLRRY